MKKPPQSLKLNEPLKSKNDAVKDTAEVLYDGNYEDFFYQKLIKIYI
jgi:hypothetical protein